jgi:hypothetical protein
MASSAENRLSTWPGWSRASLVTFPAASLIFTDFGLAGLGCSALIPLTISAGQDALTTMSAAVAGGVIAFYQVGYGIAAFGVGPLVDGGTSLSTIYGWTAVAAAGLALLSFAVARRQPSPRLATSPG